MPSWSEPVALRHAGGPGKGLRRAPRARLREPTGSDELALTGVDTAAGVAWLAALLEGASAPELSASDRDALFAAQHRAIWGDRIVSTLDCAACHSRFDLSFQLSALQREIAASADSTEATSQPGALAKSRSLHDAQTQRHWQLSTAADEVLALQWGQEHGRALLAALARGDLSSLDEAELERAGDLPEALIAAAAARLEALAPLLDIDLDADCPECGCGHRVRFDIQSWVLQRVIDERPQLLADLHALAAGYGWSFAEISALPRSLRRDLAEQLLAAASGARFTS
ncbi:hypothetical protein RQP53_07645 [Paucibacter sp. APW11]|uniref:Phage baseplate protein n=1 Tax=Roseateles aquae TaxID=3077235 RepID=A0ABU3P988_9BURK|nr:hypothetical protein [Paucibacter sp. APW11]MDT8999138.1 hypothetical protein [Paucibacter sp. APW11]